MRIDTRQPITKALYPTSVRRGFWATLRYWVSDPQPNGGKARATIKVKTLSGRVAKTLPLGLRPVNRSLNCTFRCWPPSRTYRFSIYATGSTEPSRMRAAKAVRARRPCFV